MGWYLRKSVRLGPVRFNLSKSGIGTSVGVKGFRVGIKPNGKSYIHGGRYGIYYREEFGSNNSGKNRKLNPLDPTELQKPFGTIEYKTASSDELAPQSKLEFLSKLNESYKTPRIDYLCGIGFLVAVLICFSQSSILGSVVLISGIIVTISAARWESRRRTIVVNYEFEDNTGEHFKKILSAFNCLASNSTVWSMIDSRNIYRTHESKLNAGAANLVNRSDVQIGEGKPPWVETNIDVPVIKTHGQTLYMMPDGILIYDHEGAGFVEYQNIQVDHGTTRFIETNPPKDSQIVDTTWQHPNRDGGPDRRFNNNHQLPICLYGELILKSDSGMYLYFMTSKHDSPSNFVSQFQTVLLNA